MFWAAIMAMALMADADPRNAARYGFYRELAQQEGARRAGGSRRMFGGSPTTLAAFPSVCALLDKSRGTRCSGSVLTTRWVLTAAHCLSPDLVTVKYQSRRPASEGKSAAVLETYKHPGFKVIQEDEGRGMDVTLLHHDVALVRTKYGMKLGAIPVYADNLNSMRRFNTVDLRSREVKVLGFGRTERLQKGEELFEVRLRLAKCERGAWFHCACAAGEPPDLREGRRGARGVCSGDSGGPVIYRGIQVGVTSMGPVECTSSAGEPPPSATSVFTALNNYVDIINATIDGTKGEPRMVRVSRFDDAAPKRVAPPLVALLAVALYSVLH